MFLIMFLSFASANPVEEHPWSDSDHAYTDVCHDVVELHDVFSDIAAIHASRRVGVSIAATKPALDAKLDRAVALEQGVEQKLENIAVRWPSQSHSAPYKFCVQFLEIVE